ncbi:MAG: CoA pyrophosphatase [Polyangiaceae bacterium]|nr:CoA pyrophosphatase [Polyangiaceae bacterium]
MQITRATLAAALALPASPSPFGGHGERAAAVAIPIRLGEQAAATLVLRSSALREHAGEVGFAGGKQDPGDIDLEATALREVEEELGLRSADLEVLGQLPPVPVITGRYLIHPFVAALRDGPGPRIASPEVARVLDVPLLPWITGDAVIRGVRAPWRGADTVAPHFELDGCILYGASAYIFHDLLRRLAVLLGRELPAPRLQSELPWGDRYTR